MYRQPLKMLHRSLTSMQCCRSLRTVGSNRPAVLQIKSYDLGRESLRQIPSPTIRFCHPRRVMISSLAAPNRCAASAASDLNLDVDIMVEGNPKLSDG